MKSMYVLVAMVIMMLHQTAAEVNRKVEKRTEMNQKMQKRRAEHEIKKRYADWYRQYLLEVMNAAIADGYITQYELMNIIGFSQPQVNNIMAFSDLNADGVIDWMEYNLVKMYLGLMNVPPVDPTETVNTVEEEVDDK